MNWYKHSTWRKNFLAKEWLSSVVGCTCVLSAKMDPRRAVQIAKVNNRVNSRKEGTV